MAEISFEEKVDYIYKELRWQKRTRFLNFVFKLAIITLLIFWILNISKWLENKSVISKISSTLWIIVKPIVNDLIKNWVDQWKIIENNNSGTLETPKITNNLENKW